MDFWWGEKAVLLLLGCSLVSLVCCGRLPGCYEQSLVSLIWNILSSRTPPNSTPPSSPLRPCNRVSGLPRNITQLTTSTSHLIALSNTHPSRATFTGAPCGGELGCRRRFACHYTTGHLLFTTARSQSSPHPSIHSPNLEFSATAIQTLDHSAEVLQPSPLAAGLHVGSSAGPFVV